MPTSRLNLDTIQSILNAKPHDVELGRLARDVLPVLIADLRQAGAEISFRDQALELFVPAGQYASSQRAIVELRERAAAKESDRA